MSRGIAPRSISFVASSWPRTCARFSRSATLTSVLICGFRAGEQSRGTFRFVFGGWPGQSWACRLAETRLIRRVEYRFVCLPDVHSSRQGVTHVHVYRSRFPTIFHASGKYCCDRSIVRFAGICQVELGGAFGTAVFDFAGRWCYENRTSMLAEAIARSGLA